MSAAVGANGLRALFTIVIIILTPEVMNAISVYVESMACMNVT